MTTPYASEAFVHRLLGKALAAGASDVHLKVGQPPGARVRGDLVYFKGDKIVPSDTQAAASLLLGSRAEIPEERVFGYSAGGIGRFRVTVFRQQGALSLVLRSLPRSIPTFAELGVPAAVTALAEKRGGLVIVAGRAGQGKTATLGAMIGHLNASYARHVITLEDPIELEHEDQRGSVSQREIGADVTSFAAGLRAAERHDPDVIMVSDLRDAETLEAALDAAEQGPLVIAAVRAPDVARAVGKLHALGRALPLVRERLAAVIEGVVAQRFLQKRDGTGVVLCCELLVGTAAVREALCAGDGNLGARLGELMEQGASPYGMQTFEMHQKQLATQISGGVSLRPPAT